MSVIKLPNSSNQAENVKGLLSWLGNVDAFELYNPLSVPQTYIIKDDKDEIIRERYTLILKSQQTENQIWIEGAACGFSGSGSAAAEEVLKVCGIHDMHHPITTQQSIMQTNVTTHHILNYLLYQPLDHSGQATLERLYVQLIFPSADLKWQGHTAMSALGTLQAMQQFDYTKLNRFQVPYVQTTEPINYCTSYALTLNEIWKLEDRQIANMILLIGQMANNWSLTYPYGDNVF